MSLIFRYTPLLAAVLWLSPIGLDAQNDVESLARRIATISSIAVDEYGLGVVDGRVVLQAEFDEAELFIDEAYDLAGRLPAIARADAVSALAQVRAGIAALEPAAGLRRLVDGMRVTLERTLDVALDPMPKRPPSLATGEALYAENCVKCHGPGGTGDGIRAPELDPPPADLTDRVALAGSSPLDFFRKISVGIAGTDMAAYEDGLSVDERWAVALYATALRHGDEERATGAAWIAERCPECDVLISGFAETGTLTDDSLAALVAGASISAPPPAATAYARTAGAEEVLGGDRRLAARRITRRVDDGVAAAVRLAERGESEPALSTLLAAYLVFEGIESAVGARSVGAVRAVEGTFADLRAAITRDDPAAIAAARLAVRDALDTVSELMGGSPSLATLFGQGLIIILREGIEAILIIGAVMAVLVKAGAGERSREIAVGVVAAIAASLLTAVAFATVVSVSPAGREALEGITMLLASLVLFSVASWLVSKIEADNWRTFVATQVKKALSRPRAYALSSVAFLAVYREGFETVLFYGALFGSADGPASVAGISAGLLVGSVGLAAIYLAIRRYGLRVPIKPFFAVTGILLTIMAVSFAGQGVAELQAAGWISVTPLAHLPALPALGVFPTVQTLAAQFFVTAAFLAAVVWTFLITPRPAVSALPRDRR